jgi:hypothetical protein
MPISDDIATEQMMRWVGSDSAVTNSLAIKKVGAN